MTNSTIKQDFAWKPMPDGTNGYTVVRRINGELEHLPSEVFFRQTRRFGSREEAQETANELNATA